MKYRMAVLKRLSFPGAPALITVPLLNSRNAVAVVLPIANKTVLAGGLFAEKKLYTALGLKKRMPS